MRFEFARHRAVVVVAVVLCVVSGSAWRSGAFAGSFDRMVVFGDSLSDPGNHFVAFGTTSHAPFMPVPDYPYDIGGHRFTNGATWIEQVSSALELPASGKPALRQPGRFTNYAVGRARARAGAPEFPQFALDAQVTRFLADWEGRAPADALYVLWIGANDLTDALRAGLSDPGEAADIIGAAVTAHAGSVYALWAAGARTFLVLNLPNPALAPFVRALGPSVQAAATEVGLLYNGALDDALAQVSGLPGLRLFRFDVAAVIDQIVDTQGGAMNVTEPCLSFAVVADPVCEEPQRYLFWDGTHPTRAGHQLIAEAAMWSLDDSGLQPDAASE